MSGSGAGDEIGVGQRMYPKHSSALHLRVELRTLTEFCVILPSPTYAKSFSQDPPAHCRFTRFATSLASPCQEKSMPSRRTSPEFIHRARR